MPNTKKQLVFTVSVDIDVKEGQRLAWERLENIAHGFRNALQERFPQRFGIALPPHSVELAVGDAGLRYPSEFSVVFLTITDAFVEGDVATTIRLWMKEDMYQMDVPLDVVRKFINKNIQEVEHHFPLAVEETEKFRSLHDGPRHNRFHILNMFIRWRERAHETLT